MGIDQMINMNPMMNMMNHPMGMFTPMMLANTNGLNARDILRSVNNR